MDVKSRLEGTHGGARKGVKNLKERRRERKSGRIFFGEDSTFVQHETLAPLPSFASELLESGYESAELDKQSVWRFTIECEELFDLFSFSVNSLASTSKLLAHSQAFRGEVR